MINNPVETRTPADAIRLICALSSCNDTNAAKLAARRQKLLPVQPNDLIGHAHPKHPIAAQAVPLAAADVAPDASAVTKRAVGRPDDHQMAVAAGQQQEVAHLGQAD